MVVRRTAKVEGYDSVPLPCRKRKAALPLFWLLLVAVLGLLTLPGACKSFAAPGQLSQLGDLLATATSYVQALNERR